MIDIITDGDSNLSIRTKLNELITEANKGPFCLSKLDITDLAGGTASDLNALDQPVGTVVKIPNVDLDVVVSNEWIMKTDTSRPAEDLEVGIVHLVGDANKYWAAI